MTTTVRPRDINTGPARPARHIRYADTSADGRVSENSRHAGLDWDAAVETGLEPPKYLRFRREGRGAACGGCDESPGKVGVSTQIRMRTGRFGRHEMAETSAAPPRRDPDGIPDFRSSCRDASQMTGCTTA